LRSKFSAVALAGSRGHGPGFCPCGLGDRSDDGYRSPRVYRVGRAGDRGLYAGVGLPVNLRGLSIAKVHVTVAQQTEGPGELLITGEIENLRDTNTSVPDLHLALRGEDGREIYVWTAKGPKVSLNARERVPFRARLAAPPAGVRDVLVKFDAPGDKGGQFTESPS
jgi:hypothetical protein